MDEIKRTSFKMGPIDYYQVGLYKEMIITTDCCDAIFAIDRFNNRTEIRSIGSAPSYSAKIEIIRREANGDERYDLKSQQDKQVPGESILIPVRLLKDGPVFIKEIDMVLCTKFHASTAKHPASAEYTYAKRVADFTELDDLLDARLVPTVRVFANDRSGLMRECWAYIGGAFCRVTVTNCSGQEDGIFIVVKQGSEIINESHLDLSILDSGVPCQLRNGAVYYLARTKEELSDKLSVDTDNWTREPALTDGVNAIPMELHQRKVDDLKQRLDAASAQAKAEMAAEKERNALEVKKLKNKLEEEMQAKQAAEAQVQSWKQIHEAQIEFDKSRKILQEADARVEKERAAASIEKAKATGTWLKIIGTAAVAILSFVLTKFLSGKKLTVKAAV